MSNPAAGENKGASNDPDKRQNLETVLRHELTQLRDRQCEERQSPTEARCHPNPLSRLRADMSIVWTGFRGKKPEDNWTKDDKNVPGPLAKELFDGKLSALCLSGGGIRSASFCLGILQALAQQRFLSQFDYLSTVSGGGYIGSWLSAWRSRHKGVAGAETSIAHVENRLANKEPKPSDIYKHEPQEVTNLREFTSYLTPRSGLMSSDTWAGIATLARNLALNWMLFLSLALLLVWIPKATVLTLEAGQKWLQFWIIAGVAALLYWVSELFTSRQLIIQMRRNDSSKGDSDSYGAGQPGYVAKGLVPAYFAACLAAIAFVARKPEALSDWQTIGLFGLAGAILWGLPCLVACLIASKRSIALLFARFVSGAGFGVILFFCAALLYYLDVLDERYVVVFGIAGFFFSHLAGCILFAGLSSLLQFCDEIREWTARAGGWFLVSGLAWTIYALLVLWDPRSDWPGPLPEDWEAKLVHLIVTSGGTIAGIAAALFGSSPATAALEGRSPSTSVVEDQKSGNKGIYWTRVAVAAAVLFTVAVIFELSRAFDWIVFPATSFSCLAVSRALTSYWMDLALALAVLLVWILAASLITDANKFSLHAYYRNRLVRAYLGASNEKRHFNAFTGFDENDNRTMDRVPPCKPIHVINMALNLVHGKNLAWQERKASSFTVSPLAAGNPDLGYRRAETYADEISLGTAMGISGAAASPSMGYHSSPPLTFLMTLFNVRLGQWLGNPKRQAWNLPGPWPPLWPFVMELFGLTDDDGHFIYLSDGGHFENLGIYEMLRRRCRTIVAIDAAADPQFEFADLGNAIRKARIDFGVEIEFTQLASLAPTQGARLGLINRPQTSLTYCTVSSSYCAIGVIHYPRLENGKQVCDKGTLIYIKAAIHGNEPEDILTYAAANKSFPHESTLDQFFSESQFESYRRLGLHIGLLVFGKPYKVSGPAVADQLASLANDHVKLHPAGAVAT